jgi:hypothetical protein
VGFFMEAGVAQDGAGHDVIGGLLTPPNEL